jgi:hypothetical protein
LWLSEGFATYLAALWRGHVDGDSAFADAMGRAQTAVFESKATSRPILDTAATDLLALLNSNNYQKGAWVLHQLRGFVGDSAFYTGLRRYYTAHQDSTALSADFARIMTETADRDLDWYFRQALLQPGYPMLDIRWGHAGGELALDIRQTQPRAWGSYRIPNLILVVLNLPLIGMWVKLLTVPYRYLYPSILVFMSIGVFSLSNNPFDVLIMAIFGILGYICVKLECEPAPMILGFILGPLMEENLRRAMLLSRGDPSTFIT